MDDASTKPDGTLDINSLRSRRLGTYTHTYTQRDAMLYALGLGCTAASDLRYVYEGAEDFAVLPTYAIVAAHPSLALVPLESYLPGGLDRASALHGEHYLELRGPPLPPGVGGGGGRLVSRPQLVDVQAKGSGLVVVLRTLTTDDESGREVAVNEFTTFILGKGGLRTPWPPAPRPPAAVAANDPPPRAPDAVATAATSPDQAALYRLSGDLNPLHIDPRVSARVGFPRPILHGLCSLGMSVRLVLRAFAAADPTRLRSVKVRFSKHVMPGETLRVEMWAEQLGRQGNAGGACHCGGGGGGNASGGGCRCGGRRGGACDCGGSSGGGNGGGGCHCGGGGGGPCRCGGRNGGPCLCGGSSSSGSGGGGGGGAVKVIFRTWVVEREVVVISNAAVELLPPRPQSAAAAAAPAVAAAAPPPPTAPSSRL